jgi:adenylylsulfate kinase
MKERDLFYRVMGHLGILLSQNGVNVILDATGNRRQYRDDVRRAVTRFFEVYVRCPLEVCEARDPKGIYKRGRKGVTSTVPGVGDPYEEPLFPDVIVDSNLEDPDIGVVKILEEMKKVNWL